MKSLIKNFLYGFVYTGLVGILLVGVAIAGDRVVLMGAPGVGSTGLEASGGTINGNLTVTGTTGLVGGATVGETLGPELVTLDASCTGWTLGAGWSCSSGTLVRAVSAYTTAVSPAFTKVAGTMYKVVTTYSAVGGSGGVQHTVQNSSTVPIMITVTAAGTYTEYVMASAGENGGFRFLPSASASATITAVSVRAVTSELKSLTGPLHINGSLVDATANQAVLNITQTGTKAAGTTTILQIDDVGSGGTRKAISVRSGGTENFSVTSTGTTTIPSLVSATSTFYGATNSVRTGGALYGANGAVSGAATSAYQFSGAPVAITSASTVVYGLDFSPTLSTTGHTAAAPISAVYMGPVHVNGSALLTSVISTSSDVSNLDYIVNTPNYKVRGSGGVQIIDGAATTLTGSMDPTASTTLTGVGTKFLTELTPGDKITVSAETRTVLAVASDTSLTVDTAFTDTANDTAVERYPTSLSITPTDSSVGADIFVNAGTKSSGNLMDLRVGGASVLSASFSGGLSSAGVITSSRSSASGGVFVANGALTNGANAAFVFSGKPATHSAGTDVEAFRTIPDLSNNHTGGNWISFSAPDLVSADADIAKYGLKIGTAGTTTSGYDYPIVAAPPTTQTIAAGGTLLANGCGTLKMITAAGPVTTDTTNTFAAPSAANAGCCMDVVNVGAQTITLDNNALFFSPAASDVVMTANDAIRVCSTGAAWYATTALVIN